jgi:glutamate dehydrogenase
MVERYAGPMRALREALPRILPASAGEALKASAARWRSQGFPDPLAGSLASLPYLNYGLDIVEVAQERRLPVAEVGQVYFALLDALHGQWLMDSVERLPVDGRWHAQARGVLRDELQAQQRALVGKVLGSGAEGDKASELVPRWLARDDAALRYTLGMFADMRNLRSMDFATLSVAVRRLAHLAQAGVEAD